MIWIRKCHAGSNRVPVREPDGLLQYTKVPALPKYPAQFLFVYVQYAVFTYDIITGEGDSTDLNRESFMI